MVRRRMKAMGALAALALTSTAPAGASTSTVVDDPAGDAVRTDGTQAPSSPSDLLQVSADVSAGVQVTISRGSGDDAFRAVIVSLDSPYGGGGEGVLVLEQEPPQVVTFDAYGSTRQCPDATVQGAHTSQLTISVPPICIDPPDLAFLDVLALDSTTGDILDARVLLDTYGSGSHALSGLIDGDPATTDRFAVGDPIGMAVAGSQRLVRRGASGAVLATVDVFPDALAGSSLLATAGGPLLFTHTAELPSATSSELQRLLPAGAPVYVLGGTTAVSDAVLDQVRALGLEPRRVAGVNRVETSIAVADRMDHVREVVLARAFGSSLAPNDTAAWADSIAVAPYTAGSGDVAIVLVVDSLWQEHRDLLARLAPEQVTILGGEGAVPAEVEREVQALGWPVRRIAGTNRFDTTARIERELFSAPGMLVPARPLTGPRGVAVLNGRDPQGWAFGLAVALPAASENMPFAMVTDLVVPEEAVPSLQSCTGSAQVEVLLIGSTHQIPDDIAADIDALDPSASCRT